MDTKEKRPRGNGRVKTGRRGAAPAGRSTARTRQPVRTPAEEVPEVVYTPPRRLSRGRFALTLLSMAAVVLAVLMGLSVFFRVETVMVSGADSYTPWMIREASGIAEGESLLQISEPKIASRIIDRLPYVDEVKVSVTLPGTVNIAVTELQVTYAIQSGDGSWWLISSGGRVVEQTASAGSFTRVEGLKLRDPEPQAQAQAWVQAAAPETTAPQEASEPADETKPVNPAPPEDQQIADETLSTLLTLLGELERNRIIGEVSIIDVTDPGDIRLEFGQRLVVRLGGNERMSYKVAYMASALEQLGEGAGGELDLTLEYSEEALYTPAG